MIAKLRGIVDFFGDDSAIIDVNGVGYLVYASNRTLSKLVKGSETTLFIETVVREDSISLYGFTSALEKEWFLTLTKVQGVGAKVCLSILSILTPPQLSQAIAAQDKTSFTRAAAARIVTELKGKMVGLPVGADISDYATAMDDENQTTASTENCSAANAVEDAISALVNLGYQRIDAYHAVNSAAGKNPDAGIADLIRLALKEFATREI